MNLNLVSFTLQKLDFNDISHLNTHTLSLKFLCRVALHYYCMINLCSEDELRPCLVKKKHIQTHKFFLNYGKR